MKKVKNSVEFYEDFIYHCANEVYRDVGKILKEKTSWFYDKSDLPHDLISSRDFSLFLDFTDKMQQHPDYKECMHAIHAGNMIIKGIYHPVI